MIHFIIVVVLLLSNSIDFFFPFPFPTRKRTENSIQFSLMLAHPPNIVVCYSSLSQDDSNPNRVENWVESVLRPLLEQKTDFDLIIVPDEDDTDGIFFDDIAIKIKMSSLHKEESDKLRHKNTYSGKMMFSIRDQDNFHMNYYKRPGKCEFSFGTGYVTLKMSNPFQIKGSDRILDPKDTELSKYDSKLLKGVFGIPFQEVGFRLSTDRRTTTTCMTFHSGIKRYPLSRILLRILTPEEQTKRERKLIERKRKRESPHRKRRRRDFQDPELQELMNSFQDFEERMNRLRDFEERVNRF